MRAGVRECSSAVVSPHGIAMPKGSYFTAAVSSFFLLLLSSFFRRREVTGNIEI